MRLLLLLLLLGCLGCVRIVDGSGSYNQKQHSGDGSAPLDLRPLDGRLAGDPTRIERPAPVIDQAGPKQEAGTPREATVLGPCSSFASWICSGSLTGCTASCGGITITCTTGPHLTSCTCSKAPTVQCTVAFSGYCNACQLALEKPCCP